MTSRSDAVSSWKRDVAWANELGLSSACKTIVRLLRPLDKSAGFRHFSHRSQTIKLLASLGLLELRGSRDVRLSEHGLRYLELLDAEMIGE